MTINMQKKSLVTLYLVFSVTRTSKSIIYLNKKFISVIMEILYLNHELQRSMRKVQRKKKSFYTI